ncbi:cyclin-SDS [Citrus sinensis]|uniref:Cyclin-SDS n=1 Tax=Citrus sinensis TaxID=2711 RepID=A0ACB8N8F0_CITSI|nr:cyclin-SDS [Citrus sinensis]
MIKSKTFIKKKLRSKRFRLPRSKISPIVFSENKTTKSFSEFSVDSSSCSHFGDEVSSNIKKRQFEEVIEPNETTKKIQGDEPFRRITRSYYKRQKENETKAYEVEASESSCVLSNSGAAFGEISCKFKKVEPNDNSRSDISSFERNPVCKDNNDVASISSGVESCSVAKLSENRAVEKLELSDISKNGGVDSNFIVSKSESVVEQETRSSKFDSDLACTEQFSYENTSQYSSSHENAFSELQFDIFPENSDLGFSDYTPSIFFDSGSEFSERSTGDNSPPSLTYSLFHEFSKQFSRSSVPLDSRKCFLVQEENQPSTFVRFEDEEDEESYQRFRERERRQTFLYDYAEEYFSGTEYGDLIREQRSQMVHWIVEQCTAKELHQETMFLGVSLLDRFLSRGFFKIKRNLQIVGVACLALATRIEENQPYNGVRQKNFYIGNNVYSRCEVVAMEWLVQEVLNFQCFLPTIYNFLWFYLKAAKADAGVDKKAKYLAVLALSDHEHLSYWPSTVAAALVILALLESHQDTSYHRVIEIHVRTKDNDLPDCIKIEMTEGPFGAAALPNAL